MADQMKRVHDHMNGNKSIHDDTFYYSDDDSELDSDDDSDSDFAPNLDRTRLSDIALIRDQLYDRVKKMHEEYKVLMKWEKEARRTWTPIKRMTAFRKSQAIKQWCEKNVRWATGGEAGELVGVHIHRRCVPLLDLEKPDGKRSSSSRDGNWNRGGEGPRFPLLR